MCAEQVSCPRQECLDTRDAGISSLCVDPMQQLQSTLNINHKSNCLRTDGFWCPKVDSACSGVRKVGLSPVVLGAGSFIDGFTRVPDEHSQQVLRYFRLRYRNNGGNEHGE